MQLATNGYALSMATTINPVSIAKVLEENFEYWVRIAESALLKEFSRYGEARELVCDVWTSFSRKENAANTAAFAASVDEAEKILGRQVRMYAKNARYIPGLEDLAKARTANKGQDVTMCRLTAVEDTLTSKDELNMTLDAVFTKNYATEWDKMCDDGQYTIEQLLDLVKQLAIPYKTGTPAEREAIVSTIQEMTDLGPNCSDELKAVMYAYFR